MEIGSWCSSGYGTTLCCSRNNDYEGFVSLSTVSSGTGSRTTIWRLLWRKIKGEKKRSAFDHSNSAKFSYDPYDYAQNFDHGLMWNDDSDDLSRSFSARFAVPSRVFHNNAGLVV